MTMQVNNANNGANFITPKLQKDFQKATRSQMRYRQFASWDMKPGLNKGTTANWNVAAKLTPTAPITEGANVPVEDQNTVQGSCVVQQYLKGVPFSKKLTQVTEQDVQDLVEDGLAIAFGESVEIYGARPAFAATNIKVCPATSGASVTDIVVTDTDAGAFSGVNNTAMTIDHVLNISIAMQEADVESRQGKMYCVGRPAIFKTFRKQLEDVSKYTSEGFANIVKGKIGEYDNVIMVAQTAVPSRAWSNAKSDEAFFFGETTIVELLVSPEKVISNNSINWGQDLGLGYEALLGHALVRKNKIFHWSSVS